MGLYYNRGGQPLFFLLMRFYEEAGPVKQIKAEFLQGPSLSVRPLRHSFLNLTLILHLQDAQLSSK